MANNEEITGPISQEDIEAADKLKNEANEYFKSKLYYIYLGKTINLLIVCKSLMLSDIYNILIVTGIEQNLTDITSNFRTKLQ